MSEFESCTGCWYAEHGDCSLGNEPCHEKKNIDEDNKPYSCLECDYSILSEEQKKKCPCIGNSDYVNYENRPNGCPYDG